MATDVERILNGKYMQTLSGSGIYFCDNRSRLNMGVIARRELTPYFIEFFRKCNCTDYTINTDYDRVTFPAEFSEMLAHHLIQWGVIIS